MKICDLSLAELTGRFRGRGLSWQIGPFVVCGRIQLDDAQRWFARLYGECPVCSDDTIPHVEFELQRLWRGRSRILVDGDTVHWAIARHLTVPLAEWALNVNVFQRPQKYLLVHAAVVERDGQAVVLPGRSGAGKSTLCAALVARGWRLLSDEVAMFRPDDGRIVPVPRPISLKNQAINILKSFAGPNCVTSTWRGTIKGDVAYMIPPRDSVDRAAEVAVARWTVFPSFLSDAPLEVKAKSKARTVLDMAGNAFNYSVHGQQGFALLSNIVDGADCLELSYSDLDQAVSFFDGLLETTAGSTHSTQYAQ